MGDLEGEQFNLIHHIHQLKGPQSITSEVGTSYTFHRSGPNITVQQRRVYLAQYSGEEIRRNSGETRG